MGIPSNTKIFSEFEKDFVARLHGSAQSTAQLRAAYSEWRCALRLAQLTRVKNNNGDSVHIESALMLLRERLKPLLMEMRQEDFSVSATLKLIKKIKAVCQDEYADLRSFFETRIDRESLIYAIRRRPFALVLGGGGGTGYGFLGVLRQLEKVGVRPHMLAGTSMGAILGAFRSLHRGFHLSAIFRYLDDLHWKQLFKSGGPGGSLCLPALMELRLHEALRNRFMVHGADRRLRDVHIPIRLCVAGLPAENDASVQKELMDSLSMRSGGLASMSSILNPIRWRRTFRALTGVLNGWTQVDWKPLYIGADHESKDFLLLDALAYSASVPGVFHYNIDRPLMMQAWEQWCEAHGVRRLVDGGIADNLPAQAIVDADAEGVMPGHDPFILSVDTFSTEAKMNWFFSPIQAIAETKTERGRELSHEVLRLKKVLSPLSVVPNAKDLLAAVRDAEEESRSVAEKIANILEPIDVSAEIIDEVPT